MKTLKWTLALHGGCGNRSEGPREASVRSAYEEALVQARTLGAELLASGASALDAVEAVVCALEDCPLFNAGRGSVLNAEGGFEMDAAVMCGRRQRAGAIAGVRAVRNPVSLARAVLDDGQHVFLGPDGALAFARLHNFQLESNEWFTTPHRRAQLEAARISDAILMDHDAPAAPGTTCNTSKFGTVGAVARDSAGNLAAATSTGGLTNKKFQRIGDSPVIGAGTYAHNHTCAVSCTGYGEEFICQVVAHDVACRIAYLKESLEQAVQAVVLHKLPPHNGRGGLIAVDAGGNCSIAFNTEGMHRAWISSDHEQGLGIL